MSDFRPAIIRRQPADITAPSRNHGAARGPDPRATRRACRGESDPRVRPVGSPVMGTCSV
ncbi:hypothetical protein VW29_07875 [Devosia limi DSM 17137]|uniref:Uncharacterized protein n=1 Tax=Devosia limi DSM 17137 TaxID=1121477 RepID=A0A0F5LRX1_9HYPH|nr:hypothetical protein VW29_07875 [Devosia limi DSM 17137]